MAKFSKPFSGCRAGEIYPVTFHEGDDCPTELEEAARSCDALQPEKKTEGKKAAK